MTLRNPDALGTKHRNAFTLLTVANTKTIKGEKAGYFSAILYLSPHTSGGGATLCPHSTPDCREMCLAGAGMSGLPRQLQAKLNRTRLFNEDRPAFMATILRDLEKLRRIAAREGLKPVARLNGTSDVMWERIDPRLHERFADVQFVEYTKIPLEHRRTAPPNLHLTYSYMGPQDAQRAVNYLGAGHSVAAVVPVDVKEHLLAWEDAWPLIDGDVHDLRFLDPPGSLVLLKPKGRILTGLVRPDVLSELSAVRIAA